jgi:hypothetical protein
MTHQEIARELQVSKASISLDMQYLHTQAKESIKRICYCCNADDWM